MKFRALRSDEIECRVAQVKKSTRGTWCSLLLYKDARCDMNVLDETVGNDNWQRDHKELKGNMYAGIGLYNKELNAWIWKWDCGTESYTEAQKGEASDSFKRAGFNWGIGRELYTSPKIFITLNDGEYYEENGKTKMDGKVYFYVAHITYTEQNDKRVIDELVIKDKNGNTRFEQMNKGKKKAVVESQKNFDDKYGSPTHDELGAQIINLCADKGVDLKVILEHYKVKSLDDMTFEQLLSAKAKLLKTEKKWWMVCGEG